MCTICRVAFTTLLLLFVASATPALAQEVLRGSGGSIRTVLSAGIVVNDKSNLQREWIAVKDDRLPASLSGLTGIKTVYRSGRTSGDYLYSADFTLAVKEPITAVRILFVLFDVWGKRTKTLGLTEIVDLPAGAHKLTGEWRVLSENEVSEFYASIAYVAQVRTASGRIVEMDPTPVLKEGQKFSSKFTDADLDPTK